jgi:hypothetical protein
MNYQPQVFRPTIRVNESTLRLAENLAAQHCVTIAELMEMLLLEFTDRSVPSPPPAQRRVVYLDPPQTSAPAGRPASADRLRRLRVRVNPRDLALHRHSSYTTRLSIQESRQGARSQRDVWHVSRHGEFHNDR